MRFIFPADIPLIIMPFCVNTRVNKLKYVVAALWLN